MKSRNHLTEIIAKTAHGIDAKKLYDTEHSLIMHLLLKPGEELKPHITPVDVVFYVLDGTPEIMVGDEREIFKKDDLIESPKDIKHCIYNRSDNEVRVLVVKSPKPVTKTIFIGG